MTETLSKLYIELANVIGPDTMSKRDIEAKDKIDRYGLTLLMIANGCADPADLARRTLGGNQKP
jgi:hypothetical protein